MKLTKIRPTQQRRAMTTFLSSKMPQMSHLWTRMAAQKAKTALGISTAALPSKASLCRYFEALQEIHRAKEIQHLQPNMTVGYYRE